MSEDRVPALPQGVRLSFDEKRDQWVLLAPERMLKLDPVAAEIVKLIDGTRSIEVMIDDLSRRFEADRPQVSSDVRTFLSQLAAKRMLEL